VNDEGSDEVLENQKRVALVGPELEENLGLEYLHAAVAAAGHRARLFDFYHAEQIPLLARQITAWGADLVGLSMVFTGRAREFVELADELRRAGFTGQITAGGHFASFNAARLLSDFESIDSVVRGEGEESLVELLASGEALDTVPGLTYREPGGEIARTASRPSAPDLDAKPLPTRPRRFKKHLGFPIANMLGSRGCYGNCNYCSIAAWFKQVGGPRLRQRRVADVAEEMARLYHERGVRIFNFHDDNFFLRDKARNQERFAELRRRLERRGVGRLALQVKARPDDIEPEALDSLERLGLFRVFLGIESGAADGLESLGRRVTPEQNRRALELLDERRVHTAFNLLLFYPTATLAQLLESIAFMRSHAGFPLNFGRAEVYSGTPLERSLRATGSLGGDYLGFGYRITDRATQQAFELWKELFWERNFDSDGMAFHAMRIDYSYHLLSHFHPERADDDLRHRVKSAIETLNASSADVMSRICDFASGERPQADRERFVRGQARALTWIDSVLKRQATALMSEIERRLTAGDRRDRLGAFGGAAAAAALSLVLGASGCDRDAGQGGTVPGSPAAPPTQRPAAAPVEIPPPTMAPPAPLSPLQIEIVRARIAAHYQVLLDAVAAMHGQGGVRVPADITIDDKGAILSLVLHVPAGVDDPAFEQALEKLVRGFRFPGISNAVGSVVLTTAAPPAKPPKKKKKKKKLPKKPRDPWVNEMMMSPIKE
jgi:radical SAM superfamily enzyme YgiQ (UPF0313 family)